tara:strand:- start:84 stop:293 length:210 start_codon:yes stop_codon:yes gene_type:complete
VTNIGNSGALNNYNSNTNYENTMSKNLSDTSSQAPIHTPQEYSDVISNCTEVITDKDALYEIGKVQIEF